MPHRYTNLKLQSEKDSNEDEDDLNKNKNNSNTKNNNNNVNIKSKKINRKKYNNNKNVSIEPIEPIYDSDEEKEFFIQQETEFLAKQQQKENEEERDFKEHVQNNVKIRDNHSLVETENATTTTTTTTTTTIPELGSTRNQEDSNVVEISQVDQQQQQQHTTIHVNESGQEMGNEAFEHLQVQNELNSKLHFNAIAKRASIVALIYFTFVNSILFITLKMDWHRSCDYPFKSWSIAQFILQTLLLLNFAYFFISLPDEDDTEQTSPHITLVHFRFKTIHKVLLLFLVSWFLIGSIWLLKSDDKQCYAKIPYLYGSVYILLLFEFIAMLVSLFVMGMNILLRIIKQYIQRMSPVNPIFPAEEPRGASDAMIRNLKVDRYHEGQFSKEDASCAICLCEYELNDRIRILPCKHHFHLSCVDRWLIINKACPFCKRDVASYSDFPKSPISTNPSTNSPSDHSFI
ncbi:putative GATA-binding transcription factor [Tieghemostelium lacteum]|uniref:Putative GATA-binding transcription factor n=1 Tax=Tieghemostelium lacteum TaxID=361077 RepID=A0A152A2A2_TIELA|nr:putative GATA-binding transcription factor [Tieghemostelium lacteum]|eukprot:KYR00191.1 putative GATA-binding transcription factor [Tieghemostelium lacteum]